MTDAEKFLAILETSTFEKWYENQFTAYIEGAEDSLSREQLLGFLEKQLSRFN